MKTQKLIQQTNAAEELFAELCEGELKLVCGGGGFPGNGYRNTHNKPMTKAEAKVIAVTAIGALGGAVLDGPLGAVVGGVGGFLTETINSI